MIAIFNDDSFITVNQLDWPEMRSMHRIEITFYTKISLGHLNPFPMMRSGLAVDVGKRIM